MTNLLTALVLSTGVQYSLPVADDIVTQAYPTIYVEASLEDKPLYIWTSISASEEVYVLGQRMHRDNNPSFGFGYTLDFTPKIHGYLEAGYKFRGQGYYDFANAEIAYTYLVGRHNVFGRPVPLELRNGRAHIDSYEYTFDIENSILFNIGIEAELTENLSLKAGYTIERANILWEIYEEDRKQEWDSTGGNCSKQCGYWMEYDTLRGDGFVLGLKYTF